MWIRKRLDIGWRDLCSGAFHCLWPGNEAQLKEGIRKLWPHPEQMLPFLSVRTGFDLLFDALDLPPGSEVLVSAMTIPDMIRIIQAHGLVPVPIDIDPRDMGIAPDALYAAITPKSRAIVITHLFGGRMPMDAIVRQAKEARLFIIEDLAQSFRGCHYDGDPDSDAAMFSFGTIKTATALGGGILAVRSSAIREKMIAKHMGYPSQGRWSYAVKLSKYMFLKACTGRFTFGLLVMLCRACGIDHDPLLHKLSRGFPGPGLLLKIRHKPCLPLLALLKRRLAKYDLNRLKVQRTKGELLVSLLQGKIPCPGSAALDHVYWVFPIVARDPQAAVALLENNGFDATSKQSLYVVSAPRGREGGAASHAGEIMNGLVYLPLYAEMPTREVQRMGTLLAAMPSAHRV
ncbi:MAG: DegT/DnrJ/EryC1/StrS family aminotransferase [Planctomycetota bacterium]